QGLRPVPFEWACPPPGAVEARRGLLQAVATRDVLLFPATPSEVIAGPGGFPYHPEEWRLAGGHGVCGKGPEGFPPTPCPTGCPALPGEEGRSGQGAAS